MRTLSKKQKAAAAFAAVTIAGSGTAYAYWTTTGSGSGSATVAASNGTLLLQADQIANVTPGSAYEFAIKATNAGTTDLRVNTVSTVVSSTNTACQALIASSTGAGLSVAQVTTSGVNVPAGEKNVVIGTGTLRFDNLHTVNQDACKNAPLTLSFSA